MPPSVWSRNPPLIERHPDNPILTAADWPYRANTVFNPGATMLLDGTTLLLCRVEDMRGHSHLTVARSKDGVSNWEIDSEPTLMPDIENFTEELWGIEDPRITYVPELEQYAILYTSYSRGGPGVSMAMTKDFRTFERLGVVMSPEDKDAALLPRRINGEWALVHRPVGFMGAHMWLSFSNDLKHWGTHKLMLEARRGAWWDANKIGLCNPPIETSRGWLVVYHGVRQTCAGCIYRLGLALFDLESPEICLIRGDEWIFGAETEYELVGDVGNVVFPCGHVVQPDGDTLRLYYGAADHCIALATTRISNLLDWLDRHGHHYVTRQSDGEADEQGPYRDHDQRQ
jgi:beta-1,2-mannobiose phosphorylase / 1,2-beta-oligomannan phosphorylase